MNAFRIVLLLLVSFLLLMSAPSCDLADEDVLDLILDDPDREPIDVSRMGVNNFFVYSEFGSISQQFQDIRDTLGLSKVRVLFAWTNEVQPFPDGEPFFGFYDAILEAVPPGVDILPVVVHTPSWMLDSNNWIDDDPRKTWVELWLRKVITRYASDPRIVGWQVWNEPDLTVVPSDIALQLEDPDNYADLLSQAFPVVRNIDPTKLIVMGATTSIQQEFATTLNYNRRLRELAVDSIVDVWAIHYYSTSYDRVVLNNGVADFLNGLGKPVWITESGETGPNDQLAYVETTWPFLRGEIGAIDRIYYYEYASPVTPVSDNFGMRTTDPDLRVSDLYVALRDTY